MFFMDTHHPPSLLARLRAGTNSRDGIAFLHFLQGASAVVPGLGAHKELPKDFWPAAQGRQDHIAAWERVRQDGMALGRLPAEDRTDVLCDIALLRSPDALRYVPLDKRTPQRCGMALSRIRHSLEGDALITLVPQPTRAMALLSVHQEPWSVIGAEEFQDDELIWSAALLQEPSLRSYVPHAIGASVDRRMAGPAIWSEVQEDRDEHVPPLLRDVQAHFSRYAGLYEVHEWLAAADNNQG